MAVNRSSRILGYSYARAIAAIAIVLLHTVSAFVGQFGQGLSSAENILYFSIQNNMMWAVPVFLMVSGALLLNPKHEMDNHRLFTRYILRVVLALFVIGTLCFFYEVLLEKKPFGFRELLENFYVIFAGKSWNHLWYLYCLVGLYLLLPVFKVIADHASRQQISYFLIIMFGMRSIVQLLDLFGIECGLYLHVGTIYPFYLFFGYYLRRWYSNESHGKHWAAFLAGTVLIVVVHIFQYTNDLAPLSRLYAYNSVLVILQAYGIFNLLVGIKLRKKGVLSPLLLSLDENSFGVYLLHLFLIRFLCISLNFNALAYGGVFMILLITLGVTVLTHLLVMFLRKIPGLRFIL